jgi:ferredoxin-NADP reductase/Na+-translocating ferredoxin:NAD+ oxidoreductase RnfD subunit
MNPIDKFLNNITMYRLVVYVLSLYAGLAVFYSFAGRLSISPTTLVLSFALILAAAYITDRGLGYMYKVPTNMESALITSLILFLIVQPGHTRSAIVALVLAGVVASASKFLLAWNGKHIFNPAALAAAVLSLANLQAVTWWIGSSLFWPVTLLCGLAIVHKIRRFPLFLTFIVVGIGLQAVVFLQLQQPILGVGMKQALIASPLIFLSTIMLTEPATMPHRRSTQVIFAAIVAVLYVKAWKLGPLNIYPEVALLLGNIFAWLVSPKFRVRLKLKEVQKISEHVYNYVFQPDRKFNFLPGQYMEWTLADVPYDSRGNRRTFTIASSPTEDEVHLGLKYYEPASAYKATLHNMKPGDEIYANQLAGNFTLQKNEQRKLAFIAGGIGITPFRSMVKHVTDTKEIHDIVLLYSASGGEHAYQDVFEAARKIGNIRTTYMVSAAGNAPRDVNYQAGTITAEVIAHRIPDFRERLFYISGTHAMVVSMKATLRQLGVPERQIKIDFFPGYA